MTLEEAVKALSQGQCTYIAREHWGEVNIPNINLLKDDGTMLKWVSGETFSPMLYHFQGEDDWLLFDENGEKMEELYHEP